MLQLFPMYECFNERHALAVHGLKQPGQHDWFASRAGNETSHVPPKLECSPSPWSHTRTAAWHICQNYSPCEGISALHHQTRNELRNVSAPWLPISVREFCQARQGRTRISHRLSSR